MVGLGLGQAACSGDPVDIGDNEISTSSLASYVATWEGYIENFATERRSERVVLTVAAENEGTIRFGEQDASFELPTDPDVLPPTQGGLSFYPEFSPFFEGFEYPLTRVQVETERLRAAFHLNAPYDQWCEWQTPVHQPEDASQPEYRCTPYGNSTSDADHTVCTLNGEPIDCVKLGACQSDVCACDASACRLNPAHAEYHKLDAALDGNGQKLNGSLGNYTIRLTRVQ
jgi:hypothetical protein